MNRTIKSLIIATGVAFAMVIPVNAGDFVSETLNSDFETGPDRSPKVRTGIDVPGPLTYGACEDCGPPVKTGIDVPDGPKQPFTVDAFWDKQARNGE